MQSHGRRASDDIGEAVDLAKAHLLRAFRTDGAESATLEDVSRCGQGRKWQITLGFNRPRKLPEGASTFAAVAVAMAARMPSVLKVVTVDLDDPDAVSITNRPENWDGVGTAI